MRMCVSTVNAMRCDATRHTSFSARQCWLLTSLCYAQHTHSESKDQTGNERDDDDEEKDQALPDKEVDVGKLRLQLSEQLTCFLKNDAPFDDMPSCTSHQMWCFGPVKSRCPLLSRLALTLGECCQILRISHCFVYLCV